MTLDDFKRIALQFGISALAIVILINSVDLTEFSKLLLKVDWNRLPEVAVSMIVLITCAAWRWHALLGLRGCWIDSFVSTGLGVGGNQVLPARGGDLLRALYVSRTTPLSLHFAISALILERIIDLVVVGAVGVLALANAAGGGKTGLNTILLPLLVIVVSSAALAAIRTKAVKRLLRGAARAVRVRPSIYRHIFRPLGYLQAAITARSLVIPFLLTAVMWAGANAYAYQASAALFSLQLSWRDSLTLVFFAAIGLAIPAAPSGVGTLHAAIVSAFIVLGRGAAEGLAVATVIHGVFFLSYSACGVVALAMARTKPAVSQTL